jgi:hypothetical protein
MGQQPKTLLSVSFFGGVWEVPICQACHFNDPGNSSILVCLAISWWLCCCGCLGSLWTDSWGSWNCCFGLLCRKSLDVPSHFSAMTRNKNLTTKSEVQIICHLIQCSQSRRATDTEDANYRGGGVSMSFSGTRVMLKQGWSVKLTIITL